MQYIQGLGDADPQGFYDRVVQKVNSKGMPGITYDWGKSLVHPGSVSGILSSKKKAPTAEAASANELLVLYENHTIYTLLAYPFAGFMLFQNWSGHYEDDNLMPPLGSLWEMQESLFLELVREAAGEALADFLEEYEITDGPDPETVFGA